jgi:hypothetical protein
MNNLAYSSQKPEKVAPKIEAILCKDLGLSSGIPYTIELGDGSQTTVKTVLTDMAHMFMGGADVRLFSVIFELSAPRKANIWMQVDRQGFGAHVGTMLFTTRLNKTIGAEVILEDPRPSGNSQFYGDVAVSAKLNANNELLKKASTFSRTVSEIGGLEYTIKRCFKIVPDPEGTLLLISTLGRTTSMGFSATTDALDFFALAKMIEEII